MPVKRKKDSLGGYYQYGNQTKYRYIIGDKSSGIIARIKALKQAQAILINQGRGIKDIYDKYAPSFLKPNNGRTKNFQTFINNKGSEMINKIEVGMKPIAKGVKIALDVFSLGQFSKAQQRLNYDDVIHQYLIITTRDNKGIFQRYKIEKNETVTEKKISKDDYNTLINIPLKNKNITIKQLIENAEKHDKELYRYSANRCNCQAFVQSILKANGIEPSGEIKKEIAPQNGQELVNSLGRLKGITNVITDVANVAENARQYIPIIGKGKRK